MNNPTPKPTAPARTQNSFAEDLVVMRKHLAALYAMLRKWEEALEARKKHPQSGAKK